MSHAASWTLTGPAALDLAGVFVFALSGGLAAVRVRLDLFGVVVVATVTAIGGGIVRDTLLGATPPESLRHWPYLAVPAAAAILVFYWHPQVARLRMLVLLADAAGLALFTVTGTRQALEAGLPAAGACVLGVLTGVGGGMIRDVLLREIPLVLRSEIYALAAVVGAALVCLGDGVHQLGAAWQVGVAVVVFGLRMIAVRRHWSAPRPRWTEDQTGA
ncbi:MAG TPA: TRIC cation channel family protein [Jatrophihabitantaceae bacterium]